MNSVVRSIRGWFGEVGAGWNQFWFAPAAPQTLAMIRVLGGAMLFYTHLVWGKDLLSFLGSDAWIDAAASRAMQQNSYAYSFLWEIELPGLLWSIHLAALVVFALLTLGLFTRVVSVLAWLLTLSYCHRLQGALYGLDQVNTMLSMYLMLGPSGAVYSLDAWRTRRKQIAAGQAIAPPVPSISGNIAIRLMQIHLSIVYLFGGIDKLRGDTWWDGSAFWFAISNYEYQSLNLTWLIGYRWLIAALTHITVFWEVFYAVLIWPRLSRPVMLLMAVFVHGGIALALGMPTFGLAMLIANLSFVSPRTVERFTNVLIATRRISEGPAQRAPN